MKITISSTTKTVVIDGVPARLWEGKTESGIPVHCFITRVAAHEDADHSEFKRELSEHVAPSVDFGQKIPDGAPLTLLGGN